MEITPLFALDAEELLESGQIQEAIDLCRAGLLVYPSYPSAEAILARALKLMGNDSEAMDLIKKAQEKKPYIKTFQNLIDNNFEIVNKFIESKPTNEIQDFDNNINSDSDDDSIWDNDDYFDNFEEKIDLKSIKVDEDEDFIFEDEKESSLNLKNFEDNLVSEDLIIESNKIELVSQDFEKDNYEISENKIEENLEEIEISAFNKNVIPGLIDNVKLIYDLAYDETNFFSEILLPLINNKYNNPHKKIDLLELSIKGKSIIKDEFTSKFDELKNSKIIIKDKGAKKIESKKSKVLTEVNTETMAKIYEEQGAIKEATKVYKNLIKLIPEKKEFYLQQINRIS